MRYISFVIPTNDVPPTLELREAMGKLAEREVQAGRLLDLGGLMPTDSAARAAVKKGKVAVTDGPFTEAKEVIGGFAIFEFATREEAVASAIEFMNLHMQHCPGWEGVCEVRQIAPHDAPDGCIAQRIVSSAAAGAR